MNAHAQIPKFLDDFIDMLTVTPSWNGTGFELLDIKSLEGAFRAIPRHVFVDQYYTPTKESRLIQLDPKHLTQNQLKTIYSDVALISHRKNGKNMSSISQPSLVASMLEKLDIRHGQNILEIGAGTGWNAALMGYLVGETGSVHSIDIHSDVTKRARKHVQNVGVKNVNIITGDGRIGFINGGPYDRIITTVGCPDVSPYWIDQLKDGGQLVIVLQEMAGLSESDFLVCFEKKKDHLEGQVVGAASFIPLEGDEGSTTTVSKIDATDRFWTRSAPWYLWAQHIKPARMRDLLFFAYLEGMALQKVGHAFLLQGADADSQCVTDGDQLKVYGNDSSYRQFLDVTEKWLDIGAPSKYVYYVEAWPNGKTHVSKNTWLVSRHHSQFVFKLK